MREFNGGFKFERDSLGNQDRSETLLFWCDCNGEGIMVTAWDWNFTSQQGGDPDWDIGISLFDMHPEQGGRSILQQLKLIWRILTTGTPFRDQISFNLHQLKAFHREVGNLIEEVSP